MTLSSQKCIIDLIIERKLPAAIIYESNDFIAFLDHKPLFLGHTLLAPKQHFQTVYDLPVNLLQDFLLLLQQIGKAVEEGMGAQGSFIAINNTVSQSIPHLHVHIVPRNKGDSLKGFFWPRTKYNNENEMLSTQQKIVHQLNMIKR